MGTLETLFHQFQTLARNDQDRSPEPFWSCGTRSAHLGCAHWWVALMTGRSHFVFLRNYRTIRKYPFTDIHALLIYKQHFVVYLKYFRTVKARKFRDKEKGKIIHGFFIFMGPVFSFCSFFLYLNVTWFLQGHNHMPMWKVHLWRQTDLSLVLGPTI